MEFLLEMKGVSKFFSGVKALQSVSFQLRPGTVHALMGENGAGKSTLMKILSGIHHPDEGEIYLKGEKIQIDTPAQALKFGISMIHQELTPIPEMTVAENIFLGREPTRLGIINYNQLYKRTTDLFGKIGIHLYPKSKMKELKVSDNQLVEIAKAISLDADVIIMDEPTSALTDREVEQLFKVIVDLKSHGKGIIYISHKMDEIFKISDEITVLRDGEYIATKVASDTNNKELISMMVGRELKDIFPKDRAEAKEVLLSVRGLTLKGKFCDISFDVRKGEILGIAGLMGSGRTEVMEALFGITKPDSGEIRINDRLTRIRTPEDAIKEGIAFVTEDRKAQGLNLISPVRHNITISSLNEISRSGFIQRLLEKNRVDEQIESLKIKTPHRDQWAKYLSGGNQQKVVVAKWLMTRPKILILDEPTRGIDIGAKTEIYKLMQSFTSEGYAIIMISSELPEIIGMSNRILVFYDHRIAGEIMGGVVSQEKIMELATGHI